MCDTPGRLESAPASSSRVSGGIALATPMATCSPPGRLSARNPRAWMVSVTLSACSGVASFAIRTIMLPNETPQGRVSVQKLDPAGRPGVGLGIHIDAVPTLQADRLVVRVPDRSPAIQFRIADPPGVAPPLRLA